MKNKLLLICVAIIICSCGSHRKNEKGDKIVTTTKKDNAIETKRDNTDIEYKGKQWVKNISALSQPTKGLQGRHLSLWASRLREEKNRLYRKLYADRKPGRGHEEDQTLF